jgi:hypothetical protein
MTYFDFIVSIILSGIIFSVIGVLAERLFMRYGLTRGATVWVVAGCFFLAFVKQLVNTNQGYSLFWFAASILISISLNRDDIISSVRKGPWWWKAEHTNKDH